MATARPESYGTSQNVRPRQAVATGFGTSTKSTSTVYITVNASDPFQSLASSTQRLSSSVITSASQSNTPVTTVTITSNGPFMANSDCSYASYVMTSCISASPGFMTMPHSSQASCLCYYPTSSVVTDFDDAVYSCAQYASTVDTSIYSELVSWEGFCTSRILSTSCASSSSSEFRTTTVGVPTGTASSSATSGPSAGSAGVTDLTSAQRAGIISGCTIVGAGLGGLVVFSVCIQRRRKSASERKNPIATSAVPGLPSSLVNEKQKLRSPEVSGELSPLQSRMTL
ncbi:hypothetical protein EG329_008927 [Mollisiaceae sp. DMI_Dod_QoI]|nr:hypothetical protein EG329_008927 [Helotiales sp. DMI_Dod_QoI]